MSFSRHGEIYHCGEDRGREGAILANRALAHRNDESPAGYSSAGCSPAEPASASPAGAILLMSILNAKDFAVNGKLSLITLSQPRGSLHRHPCPQFFGKSGVAQSYFSPRKITLRYAFKCERGKRSGTFSLPKLTAHTTGLPSHRCGRARRAIPRDYRGCTRGSWPTPVEWRHIRQPDHRAHVYDHGHQFQS